MINQLRLLTLVGLALCIFGTLLPWGCAGDMFSICVPGIGFPTGYILEAEDHGGFLIVLLSSTVSTLILCDPRFSKKPALLALAFASLLMLAVIYHIGTWGFRSVVYRGMIGAPYIAIGSRVMLLGSLVLLGAAQRSYEITAVLSAAYDEGPGETSA